MPTAANDLDEKYEDDYDDDYDDEDYEDDLYDFDDDTTVKATAASTAAPRTAAKGNALLLWSVLHGSYPHGGEISDRVRQQSNPVINTHPS